MPGCGYNLCFAVEPPRRGFFFGKNSISLNFGHVHVSKKVGLRQTLDFGVIETIKIGAKAEPGILNILQYCSRCCLRAVMLGASQEVKL